MSSQVLESVGYLMWAAGFIVLIIGLGAASIGYHRFTHHEKR